MNQVKPLFSSCFGCLLVLALLATSPGAGQSLLQPSQAVEGLDVRLYALPTAHDTIAFIKSPAAEAQRKPVLLFLQGSLPRPLITELPNGRQFIANYNFDYAAVGRAYHLVMISMPHTPAVAAFNELNPQHCWVPDTAQPNALAPHYLAANYLDNYVRRAQAVLNYVLAQPWADASRVVAFGHSQGAQVGARLAAEDARITHLAYASGTPIGRFQGYIKSARLQALTGAMTHQQAQEAIDALYAQWQWLADNPTSADARYADLPATTLSFSQNHLQQLLTLDLPLYVVYGTADVAATSCDVLPLLFAQVGKTNLTMKPLVGLNHNFAPLNPQGQPDYNNMQWQTVITNILKWAEE